MPTNTMDPHNIIKSLYNEDTNSINIAAIGGTLVPEGYNAIELSYIVAGNGAGEIGTVVYKNGASTIATLTLAYDSSNRLVSVSRA